MIRPVRPIDLIALIELYREGFVNEAHGAVRLLRRPDRRSSAGIFLEQWLSLEENRHTWVSVEGGTVRGLVSARGLCGGSAWEVDRLLFPSGDCNSSVGLNLLDYVSAVAAEVGVLRLFLRLINDSCLLDAARRAGFFSYASETLYRREVADIAPERPAQSGCLRIRRRSGSDEHALFRVYSQVAPGRVRQAEGLTLQEWRQAKEKCLGHRRPEMVVEVDGQPMGWLQVVSQGRSGQLDMLVLPEAETYLEYLLQHALGLLRGRSPITALVPDYQVRLRRVLEENGFVPGAEYCAFVKQLAVRLRRPALVPVRA